MIKPGRRGLFKGSVQPYPLTVTWHGAPPPVVPGPALYYASAQWPATPPHTYRNFLPPSCTLHCPSVLAFSSEDKGSWCLACRDLIAEAHFTLPKPGLIHLSTPVPLLTETCFCLRRSPACVFLSSSSWKERKSGIRSELRELEKMLLFLSPLLILSFIFLFKGLAMYFT